MTRSEIREQAFILVFEKIFNPEQTVDEMKEISQECELFELDSFAEKLINAVIDNTEKIDETISSCLRGWKIGRLPKVDLAILRLAVAEIMYFDDIPDKVSVNEAVELAKKYSEEKSPSFINGVLGSVVRGKNA